MKRRFEPYKRTLVAFPGILARHLFIFVNGIIIAVVFLLWNFGQHEPALFFGAVLLVNMLMGVVQDTQAKFELEKLQLLTALTVIRLDDDGVEREIMHDEVRKGDKLKLRLGDQVPCDGVLLNANGFEVSEAMLTGESDSFPRNEGDKVRAGDIVTAGTALIAAVDVYSESEIAQMTSEAKEYVAEQSPIQQAVNTIITYSGYILVLCIGIVLLRGFLVQDPAIRIVNNIGSLASIIVPQGLMVITTLLFALGAASYKSRQVLFQEINATEKLGRIRNLGMDKTGTLTDNTLTVDRLCTPDGVDVEEVCVLAAAYTAASGDTTQTSAAIGAHLARDVSALHIVASVPFSSWRRYGAVTVVTDHGPTNVLAGPPDAFVSIADRDDHRAWLTDLVNTETAKGHRMLCFARGEGDLPQQLDHAKATLLGVFVLTSGLRPGIQESIRFFQDRGIRIRIISGDHPETVRSVARAAGVAQTDQLITGPELDRMSDDELATHVHSYTIFARIFPKQKVRIVDALKKDGFTAMVGDGANDALAIKRADLGIAMFDGAPATRRLAGVILMNNSFTALPGAVTLADNFIRHLEVYATIFTGGSIAGLTLLVAVTMMGYTFPLLPLNITLTNYFVIGLPGMLIAYWAVRPQGEVKKASTVGFLRRIMPYTVLGGILAGLGQAVVFAWSTPVVKAGDTNSLVLFALIATGYAFFVLAPRVYRGALIAAERWHLASLALFELVLLWAVFHFPLALRFFMISDLRFYPVPTEAALVATAVTCVALAAAAWGLGMMERRRETNVVNSE